MRLTDFLRRRLLRIYPPYLATLAFSIAAISIVNLRLTINKVELIVHLLLLQGFIVSWFNSINLVLWTISIELAFYLLYPIFYWLQARFSLKYTMFKHFLISFTRSAYFAKKPVGPPILNNVTPVIGVFI